MEAVILKIGGKYTKHYFDSNASSEFSLGRAFSNDIIIDDPYVGGSQLTIGLSPDNGYDWHICVTDQTNPVFVNKINIETSDANLRSGDEITIGRTSIKLYTEDHVVPTTRVFSFTNWLHNHKFKPYIAVLLLLTLSGLTMLMSYLETSTKPDWTALSSAVIGVIMLAFIWAAGWSLSGRLHKGDYFFSSHLFFTSLCLTLLLLVDEIGSYIDYMFSSLVAGAIFNWLLTAILGGLLIGLNLALVSYKPRTISKGMIVSACITGAIALMVYMNQPDYISKPAHSVTIKPSSIPTPIPVSVDKYISHYDEMLDKLSTMKHEQLQAN